MFSLVIDRELEYTKPESALAPTGVASLAWLAYQFSESSFGEGRHLVNVSALGKHSLEAKKRKVESCCHDKMQTFLRVNTKVPFSLRAPLFQVSHSGWGAGRLRM